MQIIGLLSWYDEQAGWLAETVISLAKIGVQHVVAVDGAYELYPQAQGASHPEQAEAIRDTALACGVGVTIHVPRGPWRNNEIEKRSQLFALAHSMAVPGQDWLLVIDADEVITSHPHDLHDRLQRADADVLELTLWHHPKSTRETGLTHQRRLFRAHERGIRVQGAHYQYIDGDGRILWGAQSKQTRAAAMHDLKIFHRVGERFPQRRKGRTAYYEHRMLTGAEDAV